MNSSISIHDVVKVKVGKKKLIASSACAPHYRQCIRVDLADGGVADITLFCSKEKLDAKVRKGA